MTQYSSSLTSELAEAMALKKAMYLCQDLGFYNVIYEGDCLHVINAVISKQQKDSTLGLVIFDILFLLSTKQNWKVVHVNIEANHSAHNWQS